MRELDRFLKDIEKRAFRMAQLATRSEADALDLVQDAMLKLVTKYGQKEAQEWRPLFFKILEHRILDWHRKEQLTKKLFFWRKTANSEGEVMGNEPNFSQTEQVEHHFDPVELLSSEQMGQRFLACIEQLPIQQQQCFLLRCWEGLSVEDTASAMGINENSVKSHYFRAIEKLKRVQQTLEGD